VWGFGKKAEVVGMAVVLSIREFLPLSDGEVSTFAGGKLHRMFSFCVAAAEGLDSECIRGPSYISGPGNFDSTERRGP